MRQPKPVTNMRRKRGRPTIRKSGKAFTGAERAKQFRARARVRRHEAERLQTSEWYTQKKFIEAARTVMGTISLDPASCDLAQTVVRAEKYYTIADNGLAQPWHGSVWLNPPYLNGVVGKFVNRLLDELAAGHVKQAILMGQSRSSGADWFQRAIAQSQAICFPKRLVYCWNAANPHGSIYAPSATIFFYFGKNVARFRRTFGNLGVVKV